MCIHFFWHPLYILQGTRPWRWPKHVAGYAVCNKLNLHICMNTSWWYFSYWIKNFTWQFYGSYWNQCETENWNLVIKQLVSLAVRRSYAEKALYTRVYARNRTLFHGWPHFWTQWSSFKIENLTRFAIAHIVLILAFESLAISYILPGLTLNNSTRYSPCVGCFIGIWEQTATSAVYVINWLVFYNRGGKCLQRGTDWVFK
jgi:hypothetical protein